MKNMMEKRGVRRYRLRQLDFPATSQVMMMLVDTNGAGNFCVLWRCITCNVEAEDKIPQE